MKKRLGMCFSMILIAVISSSCTLFTPKITPLVVPTSDVTSTTQDTITTTGTSTETTTPLAGAVVIRTQDDLKKIDGDVIYPAVIMFPDYLAGVNLGTWLADDRTAVLGHNYGDMMAIKVFNNHDTPCVFTISYDRNFFFDTTLDSNDMNNYVTSSAKEGVIFQKAPIDAINWITIKISETTLQPYELAKIPISFQVPVGTILPDNWEFRITVTNVTTTGFVMMNGDIRCLVSMQR